MASPAQRSAQPGTPHHGVDHEIAAARQAGASDVIVDSSQTISSLAGGATLGAVIGGPEGAIIGGIVGIAIGGGAAVARHLKGD